MKKSELLEKKSNRTFPCLKDFLEKEKKSRQDGPWRFSQRGQRFLTEYNRQKAPPRKGGKNDGLNLIRTIKLYKNTTQKMRHQVTHVCTCTNMHPYTHEQMHKYT